jgi:hypothetical protein
MASEELDPQQDVARRLKYLLEIKEFKIGFFVKEKSRVIRRITIVNPKYFFELEDDSQNFWSDMFSAPKDVDVYLGDFYADETFNIIKYLLGDRFLEIRSPPQVNTTNPGVTSVIIENDEVEIKLAENFIQTGSVTPKFATNVNDGDVYCVLIGQNGDKLDVLCVFNFRILKIIDFLDMKLYAYINLLARKQSEPGDTISISGTNCWRIFSSLLCAIKYPDDMKIPVPGLELIFEAGLLTQNTELTGCIGNASDDKSAPFWKTRQGATENGKDYNEYMDPKELELTTTKGGGAFEILLDPGMAIEELSLAAETIKTSSTATSASSASSASSAISSPPPEADEDTSCVNSLREKERDIIFKNKEQTIEGLSQKIDEKIRNSQDSVLLPKLYDLKGKTIRTSQKLTQLSQTESHESSSVQADNSKNTHPREEEEDAVVRGEKLQAEMIEENKPKWDAKKKAREVNQKLNEEEEERQNKIRNDRINKDNMRMYIEDPDEGTQFDQYIGGRRPRRQRRKTKRNNKQTKRMKQKTNKRVNKKQTKRIKKRRTKKV